MDAALTESGVYMAGKVFGGRLCTRVPLEDIQPGDYIEFYRQGSRCRLVRDVHRGRKHNYVQIEPGKYNVFKDQRVKFESITAVWRPDVEQRAARGG